MHSSAAKSIGLLAIKMYPTPPFSKSVDSISLVLFGQEAGNQDLMAKIYTPPGKEREVISLGKHSDHFIFCGIFLYELDYRGFYRVLRPPVPRADNSSWPNRELYRIEKETTVPITTASMQNMDVMDCALPVNRICRPRSIS